MHDLILRNIRLLGASDWTQTDLAITDGRFSSLDASSESAKETIDGENLLCFPGGVDLHVHFNEPGRTHWEGFATGSLSAAAGGVTFLAEMPLNSIPSTTTVEALEQKLDAIKGKSQVDFALWGGLVPGNAD
ncbi:MAG: amidohydrolase family protein, partial [Verrucomicrobiota bacterium]